MKYLKLIAVFLGLAAVLSAAPDPRLAFIPQSTNMLIHMNLTRVLGNPISAPMKESGDINRMISDLEMLPPYPDKRNPKDSVYLLFFTKSMTWNYLLEAPCPPDQLEQHWKKMFSNNKLVKLYNGKEKGFSYVQLVIPRVKDPTRIKTYTICYLSPSVILYSNAKTEIPWAELNQKYSVKLGDQAARLAKYNFVAGYSDCPYKLIPDPTGVLKKITEVEFSLMSSPDNQKICLFSNCICFKKAEVPIVAMQLNNLYRILLVVFFGKSPELFKQLSSTCTFKQIGNTVQVNSGLSSDLVGSVRSYYERNADDMTKQMHKATGTDNGTKK